MFHKRKRIVSLITCLLLVLFTFGCAGKDADQDKSPKSQVFSVHFLNVGQGDCIYINLPDGKNVLIDTGDADGLGQNKEYIIQYLKSHGVNIIDCLILTHPDADHVGNAEQIINAFEIKTAYIPFICNILRPNYYYFDKAYFALKNKSVNIIISDCYQYLKGENYAMAFLSPKQKDMSDSSYFIFNGMPVPSEQASNDLSPIIYFEAFEKRMLFTGDAGKGQESAVLLDYKIGLYDTIFNRFGIDVHLENVDCLKVGHHGSDTSSSSEFIDLLKPKNAIISVGGDNYYGHPKTITLEKLEQANPDYNLYRTDYHGTIVFALDKQANFTVSTDLNT